MTSSLAIVTSSTEDHRKVKPILNIASFDNDVINTLRRSHDDVITAVLLLTDRIDRQALQ